MKKNILLLVLSLQSSVFMAADRGKFGSHNPSEVSFTSDEDKPSTPLNEDELAELMANLFENVSESSESSEREESPIRVGVSFTQRNLLDDAVLSTAQAVVLPTAQVVRSRKFGGIRSLGTIPEDSTLSMRFDSPRNTPSPSSPISRYTGTPELSVEKPRGFALLGRPASQISGSSFSSTRVVSAQLRTKSSLDRMVGIERVESQAASATPSASASIASAADFAARVQPTTPIGSARKDSCRLM